MNKHVNSSYQKHVQIRLDGLVISTKNVLMKKNYIERFIIKLRQGYMCVKGMGRNSRLGRKHFNTFQSFLQPKNYKHRTIHTSSKKWTPDSMITNLVVNVLKPHLIPLFLSQKNKIKKTLASPFSRMLSFCR